MPGILVQQSIPRVRSNSRHAPGLHHRPHTHSHIQFALSSEVLLQLSMMTA